jgi:hypothetical protein
MVLIKKGYTVTLNVKTSIEGIGGLKCASDVILFSMKMQSLLLSLYSTGGVEL